MKEKKVEFVLERNESCRGFLQRSLDERVNADKVQLFTILLEIIIPEVRESDFSLSLNRHADGIDITITHHGKAIKDNILDLVDDQVDSLRYRHLTKDHHVLILSKK